MSKKIVTMRKLSEDEKLKEIAYYREKRLHDEASALGYAERKGETRGIEKERNRVAEAMRKNGLTEEQIQNILNI